MAHENASCPVDLFEQPDLENLSKMGCITFIIPDSMKGSPYYNPLFVTKQEWDQLADSGSEVNIRNIHAELEGVTRGKR